MECLVQVEAIVGESPVWVAGEQALYWVDIPDRRVFRWSEADGTRTIRPDRHVCSLVPRATGGFLGAGYDGFLAISADWAIEDIGDPEPDHPGNRFNDGKVDRAGRFWAGTMDRDEREASGALYRLDRDLKWGRVDDGYRVTNGPAFSLDGRKMYHADSARQCIYAFDLDKVGNVSGKRIFATFGEGEGFPDGMTVDSEDCLWIAFWDGWCVRRLSPAGERLARVPVPVRRPTSCAFGGPALDQLFVTSARRGLPEAELVKQPWAGGLLRFEPGVTGVGEVGFAG